MNSLVNLCVGFLVFLLIPFSSFASECAKAYQILEQNRDNERKLIELEREFPECGKISYALGHYYREREIWVAAHNQYRKALQSFPDDTELKLWTDEARENIPIMVSSEKQYLESRTKIITRALTPVKNKAFVSVMIHFDFGDANIKGEQKKILDALARDIRDSFSGFKIRIGGHTDNVGSYEYNIDLSERRAKAVKEYFTLTHGISPNNLQIEGFAYTKPIDENITEDGRASNRRVDFYRLED
jgi:outer membrane protein OmpA-like peptidoglycan-associated protein